MDKARPERLWLVAGPAGGLAMLIIGWFFFISPQISQTGSVDSQVSAATIHNVLLQHNFETLAAQNKSLAQYQATLRQNQLALPSTSGLPDFLRTLQTIGNSTLTNVVSLTVGAPANVTTVSAGTAASATTPAAPGTQIYALPITAQISGSVSQLDQFLSQLQSVQPRAVLISQINEEASAVNGGTTGMVTAQLTLTMQAFVQPTGALEAAQLSSGSH